MKSSRFSNIYHCSEWIWTDFTHEQHQLTTPRLRWNNVSTNTEGTIEDVSKEDAINIWLNPWGSMMRSDRLLIWVPARDFQRLFCKKKFSFWPYNESLIDQVCSVKMAVYWPRSFLGFYWPRRSQGKKVLGKYNTVILTSRLVNKACIKQVEFRENVRLSSPSDKENSPQ